MIIITIFKNDNTSKLQKKLLYLNKNKIVIIRLCEYNNNNLKKQLQTIKEMWEILPNKTIVQFYSWLKKFIINQKIERTKKLSIFLSFFLLYKMHKNDKKFYLFLYKIHKKNFCTTCTKTAPKLTKILYKIFLSEHFFFVHVAQRTVVRAARQGTSRADKM